MSLEKVHLRKLLKLFYLPASKRKTELRKDIRQEISKKLGKDNPKKKSGGDFHVPFWADAKNHIAGRLDLAIESQTRIDGNRNRRRLYPLLTEGFLKWGNEKRRQWNEPITFIQQSVKGQIAIPEVGGMVKVENILALRIGDQYNRIIYPYFSEDPALSEEAVRVGLWLINEALAEYELGDMRILDILRGASFSVADTPLQGNERELFFRQYQSLLNEREKLWEEYE